MPLFVGFVQAGVPLGVTFSFLIAAPLINEVALVLLFSSFGLKVALTYLVAGLCLSIGAGLIIGAMQLEKYLEDWVRNYSDNAACTSKRQSWEYRLQAGNDAVRDIVGRVWIYIVIGVGVGAGIHGYVPTDFFAYILGADAWWSVPLAVLIGVPMYSNAAGIFPVAAALLSKGAALGTTLAFMMSVIALSLPEAIILRKVLKPQLIAIFLGTVAFGIVMIGYLFNVLFKGIHL